MKKGVLLLGLLIAAVLIYAMAWPARFAPVAWQPAPEREMAASKLGSVARLAETAGTGPETVIVGPDGALYTGYADGSVHRLTRSGPETLATDTVIARTGGRPLGLAFAPDDCTLYVADADLGLLSVADAPTRQDADDGFQPLTQAAGGTAFGFTDDVTVAADGRVFFTDASSRWSQAAYKTAILEHAGDGRLLVYDPADRQTRVLLDGLQFANGVALSQDERFVLVNETSAYRVRRYWLAGPKKGQDEIVIDGLPGFPDGISRAPGADRYWIALFAPRNALLDFAADKPYLRRLTWRLPEALQPKAAHVAHVLAIDGQGQVLVNRLDAADSAYAPVTSVVQERDELVLGSLEQRAIGRVNAATAR